MRLWYFYSCRYIISNLIFINVHSSPLMTAQIVILIILALTFLVITIFFTPPSSLRGPHPLSHYRDLKNLNYTDLCSRISHCLWNTNIYFDNFNVCLSFSLNALYPIKSRYFTLHISSPWFTYHLATVKRSLRKLERKIHMSLFHKSQFLINRKAYTLELNLHKTSYYESIFNSCGNDTRKICKMGNSILGTNIKSKSTALPDAVLCSYFVSSLSTKLSRIFDNISSKLAQLTMSLYAPITTNPISCKLSVALLLLLLKSVT